MDALTLTFAGWLDNTFYGFDHAVLGFYHGIAESAPWLTPAAEAITLIGEKGILLFLLGIILMCFPKTRRGGVCVFGAVCCGALITSIILKDSVARLRPCLSGGDFYQWWLSMGAPAEEGFSFPSGHVTAAMAGVTGLVMSSHSLEKKYLWTAYAYVVIMAASRNYLMAHYPTDVIAAVIVGALSAAAAYFITCLIFSLLEKYRDNKFCRFCLEFDIRRVFRK